VTHARQSWSAAPVFFAPPDPEWLIHTITPAKGNKKNLSPVSSVTSPGLGLDNRNGGEANEES
jgi:hypothetical protein